MPRPTVEIRVNRAAVVEETGVRSFTVKVEAPKKRVEFKDYVCRVTAQAIALRIDVFGVSPQQAIRLALRLAMENIASILSDDLTDASGYTDDTLGDEDKKKN